MPISPRTSHRTLLVGALIALALTGAACGRSDGASRAGASNDRPKAVVIDTFMFTPTVLHVHVGDTVTWTNHDDIGHTVTSGTREYAPGNGGEVTATHNDGRFDHPLDGKGATATFTVTEAGTFHYFCDRHPGMEADIEAS